MPTMYNPDTQDTVQASGEEVKQREDAGSADGHQAAAVPPPETDADPSPLPDTDPG